MTRYFPKGLLIYLGAAILIFAPMYAVAQEDPKATEEEKPDQAQQESEDLKQKAALVKGLLTDIEKVQRSIDIVKDQIDQTREKKYLPTLLLRLAELYVEKSRLIYYKIKEEAAFRKGESVGSGEAKEAKELAIETYKTIIRDYPNFPENVKVHFFMAHELREIGDIRGMLNQYETIVKRYPTSKYVGEALLLLGDYHFDKRRISRAAGYYKRIIRSKLDTNVKNMARYKLAWCYINEDNHRAALRQFEDIARAVKKFEKEKVEDRLGKSTLVREALIDSILCFTETKKPRQAMPYYKKLADSEITYAKVLEKLANRYFIKRNFRWAIRLYRELLRISGELEDNIEYLKRVLQYSRGNRSRKQAIEDIDYLIRNLNRYLHSFRVSDDDKRLAYKQFEVFARDIATKLHLKADQTKKSEYYDASAKAYKQYLTLFKDSQYAKDIQFNFAETLYASKKYIEAGEQYETLYKKTTDKKEKSDALFAAVSAYFDAIKDPKSLDKVQLIDARQGFLKTAKLYITKFPKAKKTRELRFAIGRTHFDLQEYDLAIQSFVKYINDYPGDKLTPEAGKIVMECYNIRKDYTGMVEQGKLFLANKKIRNREFRKEISEIVKKTEFVMIQEQAGKKRIAREQGDFASEFLNYSRKYRGTDLGEKALYNAFQGYRKKRDRKLTYISGTQFIIQYPKSQYLKYIYPTLGTIAFEIANYDKACYYFEDYFRKFPKDPKAIELLGKAAKLRSRLLDSREAVSDYEKLLQTGRARNAAEIYYDMAMNHERLGNYRGMLSALEQSRLLGNNSVILHSKIAKARFKTRNFGRTRAAINQALKAASAKGSSRLSADELSALAEAKFLEVEMTFTNMKNIRIGRGRANETKLVQRKNNYLQELEKTLAEISNYRDTKWIIATIFRLGQAYADFADFLASTTVPSNLNSAQKKEYRKILNQKISAMKQQSRETFRMALSKAYSLNIFNNWVKSCYLGRYVKERLKTRSYLSIPKADQKKIDDYYVQLLSSPRNTKILNRIALLYMRNGDYGKAITLLTRSLEIKTRSPRTQNSLGVAHWYMGDDQDAYYKFAKAISLYPRYVVAKINLAALFYEYGNKRAAASTRKLKGITKVNLNAINVIPPAKQFLQGH